MSSIWHRSVLDSVHLTLRTSCSSDFLPLSLDLSLSLLYSSSFIIFLIFVHWTQPLDFLLLCLHSLPWWSHQVSRLLSSKIKMSSPDFSPQLQTHISNYLHYPPNLFLPVFSILLNNNFIILVFEAKNLRVLSLSLFTCRTHINESCLYHFQNISRIWTLLITSIAPRVSVVSYIWIIAEAC